MHAILKTKHGRYQLTGLLSWFFFFSYWVTVTFALVIGSYGIITGLLDNKILSLLAGSICAIAGYFLKNYIEELFQHYGKQLE